MKIVIGGGSGFIGSYLQRKFQQAGDEVQIVSRQKNGVQWNKEALISVLEEADLLINLAGKSINSRFTSRNRKEILNSRIQTVKQLNKALSECNRPPKLWLNASATGIYRQTWNDESTELSMYYENDFLSNVVQEWEDEFFNTNIKGVRKVALRTSVVLGKEDGIFPIYQKMIKYYLGGTHGNGKQYVSWIHIQDYYNIVHFILKNDQIQGVINTTAPNPLPDNRFMATFRNSMNLPFGCPTPEILIRLGSMIVGVEPSLILKSYRVAPKRLIDNGFKFDFPTLSDALTNLLN